MERSHTECAELEQELRAKEQELEQMQHDNIIGKERVFNNILLLLRLFNCHQLLFSQKLNAINKQVNWTLLLID